MFIKKISLYIIIAYYIIISTIQTKKIATILKEVELWEDGWVKIFHSVVTVSPLQVDVKVVPVIIHNK